MLVNLAVLHEFISDVIPDREAIVWGDRAWTYAEFTRRTRQAARGFGRLGVGAHTPRERLQGWESGQDHVAIYAYNCNEWLEAMYGAYKARATAVNVNYRYVEDELRYVLDNAGATTIVYQSIFAPRLAAVRDHLPNLRHLIQIPDDSGEALLPGAVEWEAFLAAESADPLDLPYTADDLYVLYTGGTTGMPKGVLWRHEDVYYNGLGGNIPGFDRIASLDQLREHVALGLGGRALVALPFMHGAGQWTAFNAFHRGGTVILPEETLRFDPHGVWRTVERHKPEQIMIVGDAFARPLLAALEEHRYDVSSIRVVTSTAAVLSKTVKDELMAHLPDAMLLESVGGSELGLQAMSYDTDSGQAGIPAYQLRDNTVLLTEDLAGIIPAGGDGLGWTASTGHLPLGYLGDEAKTRRTFPVIGGVRHAVGGDRARYLPDGRVLFLGRESACINTGGEKVFVEEVERIVKSHPAIYDALVVGMKDERWGQRVTAVVSLKPGQTVPDVAALRAHCAAHLADYKIPRAIVAAPEIVRSPSGKPDYAWAATYATETLR